MYAQLLLRPAQIAVQFKEGASKCYFETVDSLICIDDIHHLSIVNLYCLTWNIVDLFENHTIENHEWILKITRQIVWNVCIWKVKHDRRFVHSFNAVIKLVFLSVLPCDLTQSFIHFKHLRLKYDMYCILNMSYRP